MSAGTKKQVRGALRPLLGSASDWLRSSSAVWRIVIALIATAIVFAVLLGIWQNVRSHVETQPEYLVPPSAIELTPSPAWIRANIKAEVIRDAGMTAPLSILDERLTQRLTQTFALHPWVAHVSGVKTSYPAHIKIELEYRRPVAMIEVHGGLLPIDPDGVLLPTEDFTPQEAQRYPRVSGVQSSPLGPLGTRWGDVIVEAAARLAMMMQSEWQGLQLHHIQPATQWSAASRRAILEIVTRQGTVFVWGSAPGEETGDESKSSEKLATLKRLAAADGSLDAAATSDRDLRRTFDTSASAAGQ